MGTDDFTASMRNHCIKSITYYPASETFLNDTFSVSFLGYPLQVGSGPTVAAAYADGVRQMVAFNERKAA